MSRSIIKALKEIIKHVDIPIADIHFHYKKSINCLRINGDKNFGEILKAAKNNDCSIRVGKCWP